MGALSRKSFVGVKTVCASTHALIAQPLMFMQGRKLLWHRRPSNLPHRGGLSNLPHRGGLCRYVSSASRADITGNEEVSSLAPDLFTPQVPPA